MRKFETFKDRSKTSIKGKNTKMKKPNQRKTNKIHFRAKSLIRPPWVRLVKGSSIFNQTMFQI